MARAKSARSVKTTTERFTAHIEAQSAVGSIAKSSVSLVALSEDDTGHRFLVYATKDGSRVDLRYEGDTFWASQAQMAEMFGVSQPTIARHIRNVFDEGELDELSNIQKVHIATSTKPITLYNLNVLIAVGYRVGSKQGTMFRMWATEKLFSILTKGFYVDKERLKDVDAPDVLDEFRDIAREIRASMANVYREVKKLCTLCLDYEGTSEAARSFYMDMENKLLWAATGMTAPQLIMDRCKSTEKDCGLTYYRGKRRPIKADVTVGNNYLAPGEVERKNRATVMWLDYIEEQLDQGKLPTMAAVRTKLEEFIRFNGWQVLRGRGDYARKDADRHAHEQYECYLAIQELLE